VILLDTHALVWMDEDAVLLGPKARSVVQQAWDERQLAVSAISFWECAMLQLRGRLKFTRPPEAWRSGLLATGLIEIPIDGRNRVARGRHRSAAQGSGRPLHRCHRHRKGRDLGDR
jgi:PIN domain nuclease of toxin-antitoxin system